MDFGKFLIGAIGYGSALLLLLASIWSFFDLANMADKYTPTARREAGKVIFCLILAFIVAVITRLILGAL